MNNNILLHAYLGEKNLIIIALFEKSLAQSFKGMGLSPEGSRKRGCCLIQNDRGDLPFISNDATCLCLESCMYHHFPSVNRFINVL